MSDRSVVVRDQQFRSKLITEETKNVKQFPSNSERSKTVASEGRTRNQKTKPSIYDLIEELKTSNNDQNDLNIISGNSDDLWWPKGAKGVSRTKVKKSTNCKKHSKGDVPQRLVPDGPKTAGDGFRPPPKPPNEDITTSTPPPKLQELQTSVRSYQILLDKRKAEINILQESMHDRNREIEALKRHLQDYQQEIDVLRKKLLATQQEMAQLRQKLSLEREMAVRLENANKSELQMIEDLSKRLKSERETNRSLMDDENRLKLFNESLQKSLSLERDTNRNLEKEIEFKQGHIGELEAKLRWGSEQLEEIKRQTLEVNEELKMAQEQREEYEKTQAENENLKLLAGEQAAELREKAETIDGLRQKVDVLKAASEEMDEAANALVRKQSQLLKVNTKLMEVNATLGKERAHVQKTMSKLESTHKKVLTDLKKMLTKFRKQLVAKFKESEDLRRRLKRKDMILAELVGIRYSTLSRRSSGVTRKKALQAHRSREFSPCPSSCNWKKKIKHRSFVPLRDFKPVDPRSSESSLRAFSDFTSPKSIQLPFGYSDRGDNSSMDGFESLCTASTCRSPKRLETTTTLGKLWPHSTLKYLAESEKNSTFLSQMNRHEISKMRNVHMPFFNLSPALVNLGVSHLINNQMELIQKSNHRNLQDRYQNISDKKIDLGIKLSKFLPINSNRVKTICNTEAELTKEQTSDGEASKLSPLRAPENDGTVFEMVSRLCSSLYDTVSKMVTENSG